MAILTSIRCLLWGHEMVQESDRDQEGRIERIRLLCIHCTKQTPGWTLKPQNVEAPSFAAIESPR
jgi:hypothetical protein